MRRPLESSWLSQVTLGSNVPARTAAYLSVYGHTSFAAKPLSPDAARRLYGLDKSLSQIVMRPPDLAGEIRIVETSNHAQPLKPYQSGFHGIDFYTSNLALSRDIAIAAGGHASTPVSYGAVGGNFSILESRVLSADRDFAIFISEVKNRPFPSAMDAQSERQFSDLVTTVLFIDEKDVAAETAFWTDTAGLDLFRGYLEFDPEKMQRLMALPAKARMGAVQFCDRKKRRRLELLFYFDVETPKPTGAGLNPGLHSIGFPVVNLDDAIEGFNGSSFSEPCAVDFGGGQTRAAAATSPAGIRFELFEEPTLVSSTDAARPPHKSTSAKGA